MRKNTKRWTFIIWICRVVLNDVTYNCSSNLLKELYKLGARKIGVFSAPPVGCLPVERTLEGGLLRMCAENQNQQAQIFNNMLKGQLPILESNLPQSRIAFVDFYNPLISIINNPEQYGIHYIQYIIYIINYSLDSVFQRILFFNSFHLCFQHQIYFIIYYRIFGRRFSTFPFEQGLACNSVLLCPRVGSYKQRLLWNRINRI